LRGLAVPAGDHEVRMIYDSWTLKIGIWLTMAAAGLLLLLTLIFRGRAD
jgi:hypothetical protein